MFIRLLFLGKILFSPPFIIVLFQWKNTFSMIFLSQKCPTESVTVFKKTGKMNEVEALVTFILYL